MTSLESIERLRHEGVLDFAPNIRRKVCMALDEIEREVSERFMELPEGWTTEQAGEVLDLWPRWDDGSPCMFGDEFTCYPKYDMKEKYEVFDRLTIYWKNHVWNRGEVTERPHDGGFYEWNYMRPGGAGCEEYRPTKRKRCTVEDVLNDFAKRVLNSGHQWGLDAEETTAEYADELREMAKEGEL